MSYVLNLSGSCDLEDLGGHKIPCDGARYYDVISQLWLELIVRVGVTRDVRL